MVKIPVLKPTEVVKFLKTLGFEEVRQRGAHKQFRHSDGRATRYLFTKDEILRLRCYVKLYGISI